MFPLLFRYSCFGGVFLCIGATGSPGGSGGCFHHRYNLCEKGADSNHGAVPVGNKAAYSCPSIFVLGPWRWDLLELASGAPWDRFA